jgi:hypothetical protein
MVTVKQFLGNEGIDFVDIEMMSVLVRGDR